MADTHLEAILGNVDDPFKLLLLLFIRKINHHEYVLLGEGQVKKSSIHETDQDSLFAVHCTLRSDDL